jgi:hypothetical protein
VANASTEYIVGSFISRGIPFIPRPFVGTKKIIGAFGLLGGAAPGAPPG